MRGPGRPANHRLCAMRFALWAQHKPAQEITSHRIAELFDVSLRAAEQWRRDWFQAVSPIEIEGVPSVLGVQLPPNGPRRSAQTGVLK